MGRELEIEKFLPFGQNSNESLGDIFVGFENKLLAMANTVSNGRGEPDEIESKRATLRDALGTAMKAYIFLHFAEMGVQIENVSSD